MAEDVQEKLLRYLSDAHTAEVSGLASLKDLANGTRDADVRQVAAEHISVTESQIGRLEARIKALGGEISDICQSHEDKQTRDVITAFSLQKSRWLQRDWAG